MCVGQGINQLPLLMIVARREFAQHYSTLDNSSIFTFQENVSKD